LYTFEVAKEMRVVFETKVLKIMENVEKNNVHIKKRA